MRLHNISPDRADDIERHLADKVVLEGTYDLHRRPGSEDRFTYERAVDDGGAYTAVTGVDESYGPVILLRAARACVLLVSGG